MHRPVSQNALPCTLANSQWRACVLVAVVLPFWPIVQAEAESPAATTQPAFSCDLLPPKETDSKGTVEVLIWTGGIIPYEFDAGVTAANRAVMVDAMLEWERRAVVDFKPRSGDYSYVYVRASTGNSSYVGQIFGRQDLNISTWSAKWAIVHELGHVLGLYHEQQRPDRDQYIRINTQNIDPIQLRNYAVYGTARGPYDFASVMHFAGNWFSINGQPTIEVLPPNQAWQDKIGRWQGISDGDAAAVVGLYGMDRDCNANLIRDRFDIAEGRSRDCNADGIPDECQGGCSLSKPGADADKDGDIDFYDTWRLVTCMSGPNAQVPDNCRDRDMDQDGDVDQTDFGLFQRCLSGPNAPADPACVK